MYSAPARTCRRWDLPGGLPEGLHRKRALRGVHGTRALSSACRVEPARLEQPLRAARQLEAASLRVGAGHAALLRLAGEPVALPRRAISERRQRLVRHGIAVAQPLRRPAIR